MDLEVCQSPYEFDQYIISESTIGRLAGVDEAGRGPLAGPVVTSAVILPQNPQIYGLNDGKLLDEYKREALYLEICEEALAFHISIIEPNIIDSINIFEATMKGMRDSISALDFKPDLCLIDGNQKPRSPYPERAIVKGDMKSAAIMAASILAKVTRDQIMIELHSQYPQYGFDVHKGYGTKKHMEALMTYGPSPIHRRSYQPVKDALGKNSIVV